jgi:NTP pyrophosphatase (non-canonical NTP hydrolase)
MNNYQDELLTILEEECGETVQEICKIRRFGLSEQSHHIKGMSHRQCLAQEMGDLLAMIQLITESDLGITADDVDAAKYRKLEKVKKWMKFTKPETDSLPPLWDLETGQTIFGDIESL